MAEKQYVITMFDDIAPKYDFLNHLLSFGIDKRWRKRLVKELSKKQPKTILDVATGTADSAIALLKTNAERIVGVDISQQMLAEGEKKIKKLQLENKIELKLCDGELLSFADNTFDAATVAFGVRNFENLNQGLSEIYRTLKPNGTAMILEFSMPKNYFIRQAYKFYFLAILPLIGRIFSRNKYAYSYLPQSVKTFPQREDFLNHLRNAGFGNTKYISLTFGVAQIYIGQK